MEATQLADLVQDLEPTAAQEALKLIVEVFRDGRVAAANLRGRAGAMSPSELKGELEGIERSMLSEIAAICMNYEVQSLRATRN